MRRSVKRSHRPAEWKERRPAPGKGSERARLQYAILDAQERNGELLARSAEWAQDRKRLAELDGEILRLGTERARTVERGEAGRGRAADIDRELEECAAAEGRHRREAGHVPRP